MEDDGEASGRDGTGEGSRGGGRRAPMAMLLTNVSSAEETGGWTEAWQVAATGPPTPAPLKADHEPDAAVKTSNPWQHEAHAESFKAPVVQRVGSGEWGSS